MAVVAIIVTVVNIFQVGVSKVDPARGVVQGQAIRPVELSADNDSSHNAIHVGPLDPRVLTPVWPEHQVGAGRYDSVIRSFDKCYDDMFMMSCDLLFRSSKVFSWIIMELNIKSKTQQCNNKLKIIYMPLSVFPEESYLLVTRV